MGKKKKRRKWLAILALLLLLAALFPLSQFVTGILSGGGSKAEMAGADGEKRKTPLEIRVLDPVTQKPVRGATVVVVGADGLVAKGRTDGSGVARILKPPRPPLTVEAEHGGLRGSRILGPRETTRAAVTLTGGARAGRVRDADGRPVAARVYLLDRAGHVLQTRRTDAEGGYRFDRDPAADSVAVQPDEGAPTAGSGGDLLVAPGRRVRGRLTPPPDEAAPMEVFVRVVRPHEDRPLYARALWKIDSSGGFDGSLPEEGEAWAWVDGAAVRVNDGEAKLPARVRVEGRIQRKDGAAVAGGSVAFRPLVDQDFPVPLPPLRVEVEADGGFTVPRLATGRYTIEVHAAGCASRVFHDHDVGSTPLRLEVQAGYEAKGRVVDASGKGVFGARVRVRCEPDTGSERPVLEAATGKDGSFAIPGLGGERFTLWATREGYRTASLANLPRADATTRAIVLTLEER